jgi:small subunit ribosomal protein S6
VSRRYEVLFVLRPDLGDAGVGEQMERVRQVLSQQGASDVRVQDWGVRDLAYRIDTHGRGRYVLLEYEGPPAAVSELERTFKISDQVLRYLSVQAQPGAARILDGDTAPAGRRPSDTDGDGEASGGGAQ